MTSTPDISNTPANPSSPHSKTERLGFFDKIGLPSTLKWGFLGLLVFMIGDGVELGYLAPYLEGKGLGQGQVALLFTVYGITVAISSWLSGPMSQVYGPRKVMWAGLAIWGVLEVAFLTLGISTLNYPLMLVTYALRGFGYPLFAYGFLVWIAAATPAKRLGMAASWFWFAYAAGLPTLGSLTASIAIPAIGTMGTLWLSLVLVVVGGALSLMAMAKTKGGEPLTKTAESPFAAMGRSISIMWREPISTVGGLVRTVNTSSQYAFFIVMPGFFMTTIGFSLEEWLRLLTIMFLGNLVGNLASGYIGKKIGLRNTIALMGAIGTSLGILAVFYVPQMAPGNFAIASLVAIFYGIMLGGYVPLSALMPMVLPHDKAGALAVVSLGAGAATWVGPIVVAAMRPLFGLEGVMWAFVVLYLLSGALIMLVREPKV
ncbi:MFS transporter [Thioclava sp. 'Guangxiensis']|uniref:MFS transporter n=1 Tax=Thioclava sp. 'Guangxiensis' TaxID=3149044 RepID=UPI00387836C3